MHSFYVQLTPEILRNFSEVTAEALNRFCEEGVCIVDEQMLVNASLHAPKADIT